ncbi:RHS repeat-associated core domain-containing protein [Chitinophaga tropicalis]|uniref:RHS repeat-associated core domain-containing protein n=1 Tax=Chitinophaga tropicalis TaxID=2683588 RepID=A0A7K1UE28_9BACT|nr:RHS repeat-associated core domain-containing protein [Chitinophaga tropicalis]MVT12593.1 hypothetical protein [Chitinophaga tropicalis]
MGLYRYGFNGKENDNEVKGDGNQQDYGFRIYDPRVGRFLSVDPLTKNYPWYTPYQFAGNKPIWATDLDGLEERYFQIDIEYGKNGRLTNTTFDEIKGLSAGLHFYSGMNGIHTYYNEIGKNGIGDQYTVNLSRTLTDGTVVRRTFTVFIPREPDWTDNFFSPRKSPERGGGIIFTSSARTDGIPGASSQNQFEPSATHADRKIESADGIADGFGMTGNAFELRDIGSIRKGLVELVGKGSNLGKLEAGLEMVKRFLSNYDGGNKVGGVIDVVLPKDVKKNAVYCDDCGRVYRDSSNIWVSTPDKATDTIQRHDLPPSAYRE